MTMTAEALMPHGTTLGHYVIHQPLGVGGMGEVYEAEDTRLHRRVALKVVRHDVAADPLRRARLEREASAAAMLNHPHIVTVYSLEEAQSTLFITMELVEGSTLADGLPEQGFPLDRLLTLSMELADALHAAHTRGIVHRDLKPANVMITRDGIVKVLDFGLSKVAVDPNVDLTQTLTGDDRLLGTVPYMSPEQLQGQPPDARSDIFSLGVMLFEMATGKRPFDGPAPLATLTSILKDPAPFAGELNAKVPDEVSRIIDRCLIKDPTQRTQSAADLRNQIEDLERMLDSGAWVPVRARGTAGWWRPLRRRVAARTNVWMAVTTAIVLVAIGGVARRSLMASTTTAVDRRVARFTVALPNAQVMGPGFNPDLALSPDGAYLAYTPFPGPVSIRRVDSLDSKPITGTDTRGFRGAPLFSPDGKYVSFITGNAIFSSSRPFQKAALSGGAPVTLTEYDMFHRGDWTADGWIYWTAHYPGGIVRIPDSGGAVQAVTQLDLQRGERSHRFANVLPGGSALIYTVGAAGMDSYNDARIDLWDLRSGQRKTLITGGTTAVYSPSGHIIYARDGKLLAVPFDVNRLEITGSPFEVLDGVLMSGNTGAASFTLSKRGDLAYVPGRAEGGHRTLVWVDRSGHAEPLPLPPASYLYPRLSPDARYLAVETEGPNHDFSVYDFARSVLTKMTTNGLSHDPVWTPDGKRIAYRAWEASGMTMWWMPADRSAMPERLNPSAVRVSPVSFSPDGRFLSFDEKNSDTQDDARVWSLKTSTAVAVAASRFPEGSAKFSPDGQWIAYSSAESGKAEVYVQPFPGPGPKIQVSNGGGFDPVWRRSGGELYYRNTDKMMVVAFSTAGGFRASAPRMLWQGNYSNGSGSSCGMPGVSSSNYDVSADGQRFLMVRDDDQADVAKSIVVVLNWAEELRARTTAATR
jgi:Tol biopolymer transport system component/tRNA A-37 threonylcarbamoyl transferase component Bud32